MNVFLRLVHGHWPVAATPVTAIEAFHRDLAHGYDAWMRDLRGLASVTRSTRTTQALVFLTELGSRGEQESLSHLGVRDIDAYLQQRCKGWRRKTIEGYPFRVDVPPPSTSPAPGSIAEPRWTRGET